MPDINQAFLDAAVAWYESQRAKSGRVNTNVMTTGLVVSRMAGEGLPIPDERFYSAKKSQVKGISGASIGAILADHGEVRRFTSEGGRTSRGTLPLAQEFRNVLNGVYLANSDAPIDLTALRRSLEKYFTERVQMDFFDKQRIKLDIDASKPVSVVIADLTAQLEHRIVEAVARREALGVTMRQIADAAGMTEQGVRQMVRRAGQP